MNKTWIDPYGRRRGEAGYRTAAPMPCEVDGATDGVTYIRYGSAAVCPVTKVAVSNGITSMSWGYIAWADRASVAEWTPLDQDIAIEL